LYPQWVSNSSTKRTRSEPICQYTNILARAPRRVSSPALDPVIIPPHFALGPQLRLQRHTDRTQKDHF
ncbi:hypothetical protein M406DRAFT_355837, partial [Cryphonectria parasitica EP155]